MNAYPLISCICIANGKPAFFDQAFDCFSEQNYPNKELVIAYNKSDHYTRSVVENAQNNEELKLISFQYCNKDFKDDIIKDAIRKSTGHYFCYWNEEDWHHASRLSYQYNSMQLIAERFQASLLSTIQMHDYHTKRTYLSLPSLWTETLLCKKDFFITSLEKNTNQLPQTEFINFLASKKMLYAIDSIPSLYIKAYHNEDVASTLDEKSNQKVLDLLK